jgi:hypothetical protein
LCAVCAAGAGAAAAAAAAVYVCFKQKAAVTQVLHSCSFVARKGIR